MPAANPPRSAAAALKWLRSRIGQAGWRRRCLELFRLAYGWTKSTGGLPTAYSGWTQTKKRHVRDYNPPAGAPCWFKGPTSAGHVCMATGDGDDVITNDLPTSDEIGRSTIRDIERRWGAKYLGWTEDYPRRGDLPIGDEPQVGDRVRVDEPAGVNARLSPNGKIKTTVANGYPGPKGAKITEIVRNKGGHDWARFAEFWYALDLLRKV